MVDFGVNSGIVFISSLAIIIFTAIIESKIEKKKGKSPGNKKKTFLGTFGDIICAIIIIACIVAGICLLVAQFNYTKVNWDLWSEFPGMTFPFWCSFLTCLLLIVFIVKGILSFFPKIWYTDAPIVLFVIAIAGAVSALLWAGYHLFT